MTWRAHGDYEQMRARLTEIAVLRGQLRPWTQLWSVCYDVLLWIAVFCASMVAAAIASNGAIDPLPWTAAAPGAYFLHLCAGESLCRCARRDEALAAEERFWIFEQGRWWRSASRRALARWCRVERGGGGEAA